MSEGEKHRFEYRHFRPTIDLIKYNPNVLEYKCKRYMRGVTQWKPHEHGGATLCLVFGNGDESLAWGLAFCCMKDNFSYRLGREIARGRALAALKGIEPKKFNGYSLFGTAGGCIVKGRDFLFLPA